MILTLATIATALDASVIFRQTAKTTTGDWYTHLRCNSANPHLVFNNVTDKWECTTISGGPGGGNSTLEIRNAINNTGVYNITVNASNILNPPWITSAGADTNDSERVNSINATVTAQTTQINNLYANVTSINTSAQNRIDNLNTTKLNISDPRFNDTSYINTISNNLQSNISQTNNYTTSLSIVGRTITMARNGLADLTANLIDNSILLNFLNITGTFNNAQVGIASINNQSLNTTNSGTNGQVLTKNGEQFTWADDQTGAGGAGDGTGGWSNTSTYTSTNYQVNITGNITLGDSEKDKAIFFYEDGSPTGESITWNDTTDEFQVSDFLRIIGGFYSTSLSTTEGGLRSDSDIQTSGTGDNLWLGTNTEANAQTWLGTSGNANFSGQVYANHGNFSSLTIRTATAASCDLKADTNGTVYCGTDATGVGGSGDGTGGWTNTTTVTTTNLNVNVTGTLDANDLKKDGKEVLTAMAWHCSFFNLASPYCGLFTGTATGSGTGNTAAAGSANHPGVVQFRKSTTAASGYAVNLGVTSILLNGSEEFSMTFNPNCTWVNTNNSFIRMGYLDTTNNAEATDGAYWSFTGNATHCYMNANIRNNGAWSQQAANYTMTNGWYKLYLRVINNTQVNFTLYNDNFNVLQNDLLNGTVPMTTGRETGCGFSAQSTAGTTALKLIDVDYMKCAIERPMRPG